MNSQMQLYVAGTGLMTPVGFNTAMTAAVIKTGVSGYALSDQYARTGEPLTLALLPEAALNKPEKPHHERPACRPYEARVGAMAGTAAREAIGSIKFTQLLPLILGLAVAGDSSQGSAELVRQFVNECGPPLDIGLTRTVSTGRSSGMTALDFAFTHLYESSYPYILIGAVDSHYDAVRLDALENAKRLLLKGETDGFVPGEGAGFLLLTRHVELADRRNNQVIAISKPGIADEPGHLHSDQPYRGEGLHQAFKRALAGHPNEKIQAIYSSMNGEHHWAKELGVARLRNREAFMEDARVWHPADCYGDLGAATAPVLLGLAAADLRKTADARASLVYASADTSTRAAAVVRKVDVQDTHFRK